jgi:hypothetical protein
MTDDRHASLSAHPRAVADGSLDALVARADELARDWAVALIRSGSTERMGSIPLGELSREAPALCSQVLRAMQSDVELDRLTGRGAPSGREQSARALGLAAVAGARDAESTVDAVEALRGVLWEAMMDELRGPSSRLVADIADRLAYVCARALAVAIAASAPAGDSLLADYETVPAEADRGVYAVSPEDAAPLEAVIVDEREEVQLAVLRAPDADSRLAHGASVSDAERPLSWDESPPVPPASSASTQSLGRPLSWDESPPVRPSGAPEEIEIRDERGEEGPAAWIGSIGHQLMRFQEDGLPFAVLLVELLEIESVRREESAAELAQLAARVQDALAEELRAAGSGSLTCESPGRYWLLALETDRSDAERLADGLARAVASSVHHRQVPVAVVVGAAVCPDDGLLAPMLAAHADVGLYAARSAARSMSGRSASA